MGSVVVFVTGRNPTHGMGGGSSYVRAHMRAAQRAGFEPHVFCIDARGGVCNEEFGTVHRVPPPALLRWAIARRERRAGFLANWLAGFALSPYSVGAHAPRLAANIAVFLRSRPGPHLIHGFYTWGCVALDVCDQLAARGAETIVLNSFYTTAGHEARAKAWGARANLLHRAVFRAERFWIDSIVRGHEHRAYTQTRIALVNYESVRALLRAAHGAGAELRKIPYSAETAFTCASTAPPTAPPVETTSVPLIVAVSRHDPRKGIDALLRALALLRAGGVLFRACLVGGGPLLATHRRLAERLGLGDTVAFMGWVPDPLPYLRAADVFVLPSLQEGSGSIALLEAMQAGRAIVATNVDGIPEDVSDGDSALLVPPSDADALRRALARALTNPALRERLGRRARATFERGFTAEAFSAALGRLYTQLGVTARLPTVPASVLPRSRHMAAANST